MLTAHLKDAASQIVAQKVATVHRSLALRKSTMRSRLNIAKSEDWERSRIGYLLLPPLEPSVVLIASVYFCNNRCASSPNTTIFSSVAS